MQNILDWGIEVVLWFQRFSPELDLPFKALTHMGAKFFFMLLLPFIYWCVDRRTGARLTILFLLSAHLNAVAKWWAAQPRPFQYDTRVLKLIEARGGGLPSGHTQSAVVVWGYLASQFPRPWLLLMSLLLMLLIPLSRIYLGVHFPTDLLGGYLLGTALLVLYLRLAPGLESWFKKRGLTLQLAVAFTAPVLMILLFPKIESHGVTAAGTLLGMGVGFALERRWVRFHSGGAWWRRLLRFLLGEGVFLALWLLLRSALYGFEPEIVLRFLRYGLLGLWGGLGAPWAFVKLRLAEVES